jgi:hypothetical protein
MSASRRIHRVVAATQSTDPGRNFVAGPYPGDVANVGLIIPSAPTTSQFNRYLGRLCAFEVPMGHRAIITSIRQLLTISAKVPIYAREQPPQVNTVMEKAKKLLASLGGDHPALKRMAKIAKRKLGDDEENGDDPCEIFPSVLIERQVKTPFWSLPDGNVIWFLRAVPIAPKPGTAALTYQDSYDRNPFGYDPAWIYLTNPIPYAPPSRGIPPGTGISDYGIWRDMRFPWYTHTSNHISLDLEVRGPCVVTMYASVWQGDPSTRVRPAGGSGPENFMTEDGSELEDKFWIAYPCTNYHRIAGEITAFIEMIDAPHEAP